MAERNAKTWTPEEERALTELLDQGSSTEEIAIALDRTYKSIEYKRKQLNLERRAAGVQRIKEHALAPPIDTDDKERIRHLEAENARLRQQLTWAQHSESVERTGGVMTIRMSDVHHADENHMLSCYSSVVSKLCEVIRQYEPDRIQYVGFDDWIAGTGIYKDQDLHSAVSDAEGQINVGALEARRLFRSIRRVTQAPIDVAWIRGNHEYARGTSIAAALFHATHSLSRGVPSLRVKMHWDVAVVNLAAQGYYHMLVMHGFGNSKNAPNSPAFIEAAKDKIILLQRKLPGEQQIRRVSSGHTHWLSSGIERIIDLPFDTTGGFQRNTRVKLGFNQRPIGCIVYVSPRGQENDILKPIEVKPEYDAQEREISDPTLTAANRAHCGKAMAVHSRYSRYLGLVADGVDMGLLTEGRW
jgi:transposase-like protein